MISVSIVEDHDYYRLSLIKMLESDERFRIIGVYTNAEEAIEGLKMHPPDIAIIDIVLKEMSGTELIRSINSYMPDTQFLMCTSYKDNDNVFKALRAGASGYIVKDASSADIQDAIVDLHNGGAPMSPYIARQVIKLMQQKYQIDDYQLSVREKEVLTLLSDGRLYKEISDTLAISLNTVKNHLKNIYKKLHVQNKVEAINKFRS